MITGVDFVMVPTDDFERAIDFYTNVLGLPETARYGRHPGAEFETGNLTLAVMESKSFGMEFKPNGGAIALQVADVDVARAELEAKGVSFAGPSFDSGVCWQAIFHDPDGNPYSLHHRYAPRG